MTPLYNFRDEAASVGIYIANVTAIETIMPAAFANAVGMSQQQSMSILMQFRNISDRVQVIEDYLGASNHTHAASKILKDLMPHIKTLNSFRNSVAHGTYSEEDGDLFLITWVFAKNKKPQKIHITHHLMASYILQTVYVSARMKHVLIHPLEPLPDNMPQLLTEELRILDVRKSNRSGQPARPPSPPWTGEEAK